MDPVSQYLCTTMRRWKSFVVKSQVVLAAREALAVVVVPVETVAVVVAVVPKVVGGRAVMEPVAAVEVLVVMGVRALVAQASLYCVATVGYSMPARVP